jgi:hypothetical protein
MLLDFMKAQSAVEFLATYAWAFLILTIFISVIIVLVTIKSPAGYSPSSCYITTELACSESIFASNPSGSIFAIAFSNNFGTNLTFGQNSIVVILNYRNASYNGTCLPSYAPKGSAVVCSVNLAGISYSPGSQINPSFKIRYSICNNQNSCSAVVYNTSGSASDTVAYGKNLLSKVLLYTNTGTGHIILGGTGYASNTIVLLINNIQYLIYAQPPNGYTFNSWIASTNLTVLSNAQSSSVSAKGPGNLEATFTT